MTGDHVDGPTAGADAGAEAGRAIVEIAAAVSSTWIGRNPAGKSASSGPATSSSPTRLQSGCPEQPEAAAAIVDLDNVADVGVAVMTVESHEPDR